MKKTLHKYFIPGEHNDFHPHILHSKRTIFYGIFFSSLKLLMFVFALSLPVEVFVLPDVLAEERKQIIELTNEVRIKNYLPALQVSNELSWSSEAKAEDMASKKYFAHKRNKKTAANWLAEAGYDFEVAGENLAVGFRTPEEIVKAWVNSPTHYSNIVDFEFVDTGVGLAGGIFNGEPAVYIVQHFGSPAFSRTADSGSSEVVSTGQTSDSIALNATPQDFLGRVGLVLGQKFQRITEGVPLALETAGSTPVKKYLHAKSVLSPVTNIFAVAQSVFFAAMLFFVVALGLKVFIAIKRQYPRVIAETSMLIAALFIFWKY